MRNWNWKEGIGMDAKLLVFRLPMRNWNMIMLYPLLRPWDMVFRLPMRNWNNHISLGGRSWSMVFRLPMRNWNISWYPAWWWGGGFLDYLWGIETRTGMRFRAWFIQVFRLPMRNWNLYSGDESSNTPSAFLDYLWGIETLLLLFLYLTHIKFLDYLWGIETLHFRPVRRFLLGFLDYLWGIETWTSKDTTAESKRVFRLPMRNWNLLWN